MLEDTTLYEELKMMRVLLFLIYSLLTKAEEKRISGILWKVLYAYFLRILRNVFLMLISERNVFCTNACEVCAVKNLFK